jgi:polar amino acid transport system substrate-binding protein
MYSRKSGVVGMAGRWSDERWQAARRAVKRKLALALLVASAPAAADGSLDRVTAAKVLTVAVVANAPWAMKGADGRWQGYDIDVVTRLAADLGVAPRFVETRVDEVPQRLSAGADLAAGGLMIRPDLARELVYSTPIGLSVVRTVGTHGTGRLPAFGPETRVAVLQGSVAEQVARHTYPNAKTMPFPSSHDAVAAVLHGGADALVASTPVPRLVSQTFDGHLRLVGPPLAKTAEALALRPDDGRLTAYVNNWIAAKAADGWLQHLRHHWFVSFGWVPDSSRAATGGAP